MALITWNESLSVMNELMDNQHKVLIRLINELHAAMKEGKSSSVLDDILDELVRYTIQHFTAEEHLLTAGGFPSTDEHTDDHRKFIGQIEQYRIDFANHKSGVSIALINYLSDWLREHILGSDKQYAIFFETNKER